jgi:hypothetical protein
MNIVVNQLHCVELSLDLETLRKGFEAVINNARSSGVGDTDGEDLVLRLPPSGLVAAA